MAFPRLICEDTEKDDTGIIFGERPSPRGDSSRRCGVFSFRNWSCVMYQLSPQTPVGERRSNIRCLGKSSLDCRYCVTTDSIPSVSRATVFHPPRVPFVFVPLARQYFFLFCFGNFSNAAIFVAFLFYFSPQLIPVGKDVTLQRKQALRWRFLVPLLFLSYYVRSYFYYFELLPPPSL